MQLELYKNPYEINRDRLMENTFFPSWLTSNIIHDDVIKLKYFLCCWPIVRESSAPRWIPFTKASDAELRRFLWSAPEETAEQTIETLVIWDDIALIMTSL